MILNLNRVSLTWISWPQFRTSESWKAHHRSRAININLSRWTFSVQIKGDSTTVQTQWRFGPGITDPRKTTLRQHRFPVLHMIRPKSGTTKFRHPSPVDVSSMFFTWDRRSQQVISAVTAFIEQVWVLGTWYGWDTLDFQTYHLWPLGAKHGRHNGRAFYSAKTDEKKTYFRNI